MNRNSKTGIESYIADGIKGISFNNTSVFHSNSKSVDAQEIQPKVINSKRSLSLTTKINNTTSASKMDSNKKTVAINLNNKIMQTDNSSQHAVDTFLKNFAQAVIFKINNPKRDEKRIIFTKDNSFDRKIKHNPKQIVDIVQDVSITNNFKIKDFGNFKYELKRENITIISEITQLNLREPKMLKFTFVKGNKKKASDFVLRILDDIEILEENKKIKSLV